MRQTFSSPRTIWQILWADSEAVLGLLGLWSGVSALILVFGSHFCGFVKFFMRVVVVLDEN